MAQQIVPVGDARRVKMISLDPANGKDKSIVGEAWQDADGVLHGTGIAAVMFYEALSLAQYSSVAIAKDISPLSVFLARIARSSLIRIELVTP